MFGLLYALGVGIGTAVSGIKGDYQNALARDRGVERVQQGQNSENIYCDRKGTFRDIDTDEIRDIVRDFDSGDRYLTDVYGNRLRNLSEEERIKKAAQAAANAPEGTIAVEYAQWIQETSQLHSKAEDDNPRGTVYKDIQTGDLYFKRIFAWNDKLEEVVSGKAGYPVGSHCGIFYMKVSDGLLFSSADEMNDMLRKNPIWANEAEMQKFMRHFNYKQRNGGWIENKIAREINPMRTYYCDDKEHHYGF